MRQIYRMDCVADENNAVFVPGVQRFVGEKRPAFDGT